MLRLHPTRLGEWCPNSTIAQTPTPLQFPRNQLRARYLEDIIITRVSLPTGMAELSNTTTCPYGGVISLVILHRAVTAAAL